MNTDHRMDELLRQKLGGYQLEPSPGVWEGISGRLEPPPTTGWKAWLNTLILPLGVMLITGGFYLFPGQGQQATIAAAPAVKVMEPAPTAEKNTPTFRPAAPAPLRTASTTAAVAEKPVPAQPVRSSGPSGAHVSSNAPLQTTPNLHSPSPAVPTGEPEASTSVPLPETPATLLTPATGNSDLPTATLEPAPVSQAVPPALALHTETPAALVMNTMQAALTLRPVPFQARYLGWEPIFPAYSHVNRTQHTAGWKKTLGITGMERTIRPEWSLGLFYIPEIYHSEDLHAEKTLYGFDGMMRYTWFNYTLEFGLGLSRVRNENLYTVDYNAYLGTYKDLDSIAFSVDTVNQVIVPQYFFSEVKVYDSTTSQYFERTVNTYTYVQFPLMLGYRHPLGRFSLSLRGGPMLSVLVGSREPQIYVDQASDRILRVDDQTPGRIRTNWQFLMNAGLSYALTRKLSLSLEPGIRYYLNPIYQELQTKPWSVNLRTGIIYEF